MSLSDDIATQRIARSLDGPKPPANPLARLIGNRKGDVPQTTISPKLARARQVNAQRRARQKAETFFTAIGKLKEFRRWCAQSLQTPAVK